MSADRCGMLETQATVRSLTGVGGFNVDGDWEPWGEKHNTQSDRKYIPISLIANDSLQEFMLTAVLLNGHTDCKPLSKKMLLDACAS